ncbi:MAG TPA: class I SAM-dependent methyltransferase [Ktedonobacterales bacterium]|nr:class I SAM-dependent methyltransferase [Ktedonobacterales bacterium]
MNDAELAAWFAANQALLETAYLAGTEPWQQSGFGLHSQRDAAQWAALRRPIADAVTRSGSFLDIGCANGYLLECVMGWLAERGLTITPYGLDFADGLIALARQRQPHYADQLFVGNAWDWSPPRRFDYARVSLEYVPDDLRAAFIARLLRDYLVSDGRLLVAEYRSRDNTAPALTIDADLRTLGFAIEATTHSYLDGVEFTRVAVVGQT